MTRAAPVGLPVALMPAGRSPRRGRPSRSCTSGHSAGGAASVIRCPGRLTAQPGDPSARPRGRSGRPQQVPRCEPLLGVARRGDRTRSRTGPRPRRRTGGCRVPEEAARATQRACTARRRRRTPNPVPTQCRRRACRTSDTWIGSPSRKAPPPRTAANVSPYVGTATTPTTVSRRTSAATLTAQPGRP